MNVDSLGDWISWIKYLSCVRYSLNVSFSCTMFLMQLIIPSLLMEHPKRCRNGTRVFFFDQNDVVIIQRQITQKRYKIEL